MSLSDRIIDEGLLSRIKGLVSPQREMPKNVPVQRKRPRGPAPSTPSSRPQPRHPAFQALARKHAAYATTQHHINPKAVTEPVAQHPQRSTAPPHQPTPQAKPVAAPSEPTKIRSQLPAKRITQASPPASQRATKSSPALGAKLAWLGAGPPAEPTPTPPAPAEQPGVLSTRHKPGTLAHTVHLFRQAKEIRSQIGRPVHVVQHAGKRFITTKPSAQHKILHTYEQEVEMKLAEAIAVFRSLDERVLGHDYRKARAFARQKGFKYGLAHLSSPEGKGLAAKVSHYEKRSRERLARNPAAGPKIQAAMSRAYERRHGPPHEHEPEDPRGPGGEGVPRGRH